MRYRELLNATLSGQFEPVNPVAAWQHKPMLDQTALDFADATIFEQQKFDFDFAKLTPASTWQSIDNGLIDKWNNDHLGRRELVQQSITQPQQWFDLKLSDPWQGFSGGILKAAQLIRNKLPAHIPVVATVFNPIFQAVQQAGLPLVLECHQHHKDELNFGLNMLCQNTLNTINCFQDIGIDGIFFVSQHATSSALPENVYQDLALKADLRCLEAAAKLPFSMLHLHGKEILWQLFAGPESLPLHYDTQANPSLAMLSKKFTAIGGGLSPESLFLAGNTPQIEDKVLQLRQELLKQPYLVSPGCALPLAVPDQHIHAMVAAARSPLKKD